MALYRGMSKGERNRIKIRVRAAMASQAATERRFFGGRTPYGYRLVNAGPHPNPAKPRTASACTARNRTRRSPPSCNGSSPRTWPARACTRSLRPSPRTASPALPPTTRPATGTAPVSPGPRALCAPSCSTPATPATRSGTANARTRYSSTSTTSRRGRHGRTGRRACVGVGDGGRHQALAMGRRCPPPLAGDTEVVTPC
jgi:hypothetical protein